MPKNRKVAELSTIVAQVSKKNIAATLAAAKAQHKAGSLEQAEELYQHVLQVRPRHADALQLLATLEAQRKNFSVALGLFDRALKIEPAHPQTLNNRGNLLRNMSRFEEALQSYDDALKSSPDFFEALYNRGNVLRNLKRDAEAVMSYDTALKIKPEHTETYFRRGNALRALKRHEEAVTSYENGLKLKPEDFGGLYNRGNALFDLKQFEKALESYDHALAVKQDYAEAHINRGNTLRELGRQLEALLSYGLAVKFNANSVEALINRGNMLVKLKRYEDALESYDLAIKVKPNDAQALHRCGNVLHKLNRISEALRSYDAALSSQPPNPEIFFDRGNLLSELSRYDEALNSYDRALMIFPNYAEALNNKGNLLVSLKRYREADASYTRALEIDPNFDFLRGAFLHNKMKLCDWTDIEREFAELKRRVAARESVSPPFPLLAILNSRVMQKEATEILVKAKYPPSDVMPEIGTRMRHDKIRIGYFSSDFYEHATSYLMAELFEAHDRSQFEVTGFSFGPDVGDKMQCRVSAGFDHFVDVGRLSDQAIAKLARDMEIDIAIDLKGFTRDNRLGVFSMRAAPLQVNYLGYPGTIGADYMDYLIADATLIPESHRADYAEKIAYMPNSYQANDTNRQIDDTVFTRAQLGLPDNGFIFCCFNNSYKLNPDVFDVWMRILAQVKGSVLWLLEENSNASASLRLEAQRRRVDGSRLIFAPRLPLSTHLARHRVADLFLDTLPCNAHTTTSDALWAGLPVLTRLGETFAGRVAASLLNAIELPELITTTLPAYEALAIELAMTPDKLTKIKQKLTDNRLTTPLFNCRQTTRNIEALYIAMIQRYQAGLAPDHIMSIPQA